MQAQAATSQSLAAHRRSALVSASWRVAPVAGKYFFGSRASAPQALLKLATTSQRGCSHCFSASILPIPNGTYQPRSHPNIKSISASTADEWFRSLPGVTLGRFFTQQRLTATCTDPLTFYPDSVIL